MSNKLDYLRKQAAAYPQDAKAADNDRKATRLIMLAIPCQEQILALEQRMGAAN